MKDKIKRIGSALTAVLFLSVLALNVVTSPSVSAAPADPTKAACNGVQNAITGGCNDSTNVNTVLGWVGTITSWLLWAIGAVCVIFIIIGGLKYATSGGDPEKVKSAKNTLLYALIGLAIAILAGVIVSLVVNALVDVQE
jgi:hypothetical protein